MSIERKAKRQTYFDVDTVLEFGKYKYYTIAEIAEDYPYYLMWMIDNFEDVIFTDDVLELAQASLPAYDSDGDYKSYITDYYENEYFEDEEDDDLLRWSYRFADPFDL